MSPVELKKTKKRKHTTEEEPSSKRSKTEKVKDKAKEKGKKAATRADSGKKNKGKEKAVGEFSVVQSSLAISIPPVFANNLRAGAEEMLDSMIMRYIPSLQGVVLAYDDLQFLESVAAIKADCPFANCRISFNATVWSPHIGMKLVGKVNLCSPDHVSLLVHRTFNVSIPRHHIPTDHWVFEYGPAENDPEFGAGVEEDENAEQPEDSGRWVHKITGERLGGTSGNLEFTVIGLTIANQMLSLVGSIQPDPFSPAHVPDHSIISTTSTVPKRRVPEPQPIAEDTNMADGDAVEDAVDSEEEDTFEMLGRMGDAAKEAARVEEAAEKKERKRKRKEKTAAAGRQGDAAVEQKKKKKKTS